MTATTQRGPRFRADGSLILGLCRVGYEGEDVVTSLPSNSVEEAIAEATRVHLEFDYHSWARNEDGEVIWDSELMPSGERHQRPPVDVDEVDPPEYRAWQDGYGEPDDPRYDLDEILCASGRWCAGGKANSDEGAPVGMHLHEYEDQYGTREGARWITCYQDAKLGVGPDPRHPLWWCEDCVD